MIKVLNRNGIFLTLLFSCIFLIGCSASRNETAVTIKSMEPQGGSEHFNKLFDGLTVDSITIKGFDTNVGKAILKTIEDKNLIAEMMHSFDNWDMDASIVSAEQIIDGEPEYEVVVGKDLLLSVFDVSDDKLINLGNGKIYGFINGKAYFMPREFSEWVYRQIAVQ